jgi:hypothetical protein
MKQIKPSIFRGLFVIRLLFQSPPTATTVSLLACARIRCRLAPPDFLGKPSALRGDPRRPSPWSLPPCRALVPWAFAVLPFLGRFRAVRAVVGVFVRARCFVRSYSVIFEPWRVLRCALRVPLPFSLDFSPFLARFSVGDI